MASWVALLAAYLFSEAGDKVVDQGTWELDFVASALCQLYHSYRAGPGQRRWIDRKVEASDASRVAARASSTLYVETACLNSYWVAFRTSYWTTRSSLSGIFLEAERPRICYERPHPSGDRVGHRNLLVGNHCSEIRADHSLPCSVKR